MSTMAKKGLGEAALGSLVCFFASKWTSTRFSPISFSRGILKVSVSSAAAASELQMKEEDLIDFLNGKIKKKVVKRIRILNFS